jgi:MutS domain V
VALDAEADADDGHLPDTPPERGVVGGGARSPGEAYATRLEARRAEARVLELRDRNLSVARGVVGVLAFVAWLAMALTPAALVALVGAALAFLALVVFHESVARQRARVRRRVAFYEAAVARMKGDWAGRGEAGARFEDPTHPYAADLDLFGRGSLYERVCAARTHAGQDALAAWLLSPAAPVEVRDRQGAVAELGPRVDLREDLAALGAEARQAVDSTALGRWASTPPVDVPRGLRVAGFAASALALGSLAGWTLGERGPFAFYLATALVAFIAWLARPFTERVLAGLGRPAHDLQTLTALFDRLVGERFESPGLARLHRGLSAEGQAPGRPIAQLRRWLEVHDSKRNVFFAPVAFYLLWDLHLSAAVEGWRRRFGSATLGWLGVLGELEALVSLGGYAFENPADPYPLLDEAGPILEARGLGHPLLPEARSVRNDVDLDAERQMLVVTGSNMSGKSTLLRTVGVNVVLALAGAPVRAASLRLGPLAVGASIRVQDSLQDGESRFYAEIKRIRQIMELAKGAVPALFLLDEIFDGTNSAERRLGAEAVVRALLDRRAIGLVTSHDLALADIAESLAPRAANVHFVDHLEGDRIAFDYRLKPGPVRKGNALALMRAVGLEV